jgi:serine/threonine protein kinase
VCDVAKLLDFGLVKKSGDSLHSGQLTLEGTVPGTPSYMSPEQAADSTRLDRRTDLSSLGAVAYFLLTGQPPFVKDSIMQLYAAHMYETVLPMHKVCPGIPGDLERVVLRCLEKDPTRRFDQARELEQALAACDCASDWTQNQAAEWWKKHGTAGDAGTGTRDGTTQDKRGS